MTMACLKQRNSRWTLRWAVLLLFLLSPSLVSRALGQVDALRSGPMVGYATLREAQIWVQTTRAAEVQILYWIADSSDSMRSSSVVTTSDEKDFVARFTLSHLEPGQQYEYALQIDGHEVERPYPLLFQTQPHWQWRTDPPEFTVAFGSCAYINDPPFDRPGTPYGQSRAIFTHIAEMGPDLMLWLGDNTYYREGDYSPTMMSRRYAHTRAAPEMQALLGSTHNYAIWDDHDYGPNNSDRSFVLKGAALHIFKRYWANPTYGLPEVPGVFGKFTWGDIDFFLLDNRYHRSPNRTPIDSNKVMFGKAQMDWLIDALTESFAPFKIVATGGQVLNEYDFYEMMVNFPHERKRLIDAIVERDIRGVVFITGDRHHSELLRLVPDGGYPLYDFTNSPLTAGAHQAERELENPLRVEGTLVRTQNFGTLTFSGPRRDRSLEMRSYDADGQLLWSHTVHARDLRATRPDEQ